MSDEQTIGGDSKPVTLTTAGKPGSRCPICGKPSKRETRPFCSRRCADIDLSRWLGGVYAVPKMELDEGDEDLLEGLALEAERDLSQPR